jgi:hypothetical protein
MKVAHGASRFKEHLAVQALNDCCTCRDVSSSDKEKKRKTDKVDALKLARNLASGDLTGIHVPDEDLQKERNLLRFPQKTRWRSEQKQKPAQKFIEISGHQNTGASGKEK